MTTADEVVAGTLIAGRFRIEELLGSGGMATVYRATDLARKTPIAIKLLRAEVSENKEAIERLKREGEVLSSLKDPHIVALETFGKLDDGRIFVAMELLSGETLGTRMRREQKMSARALTPIVQGACAGLEAAHRAGVIHRDLKPDNIFVVGSPDQPHVKLLDFGISKVLGSQKLTHTGQVLGTPRYMAPEQLSAERMLDARVDVYALGVILYEALGGAPPFLAATPADLIVAILQGRAAPIGSLRPDLPPALETVVTRAMARSKEARYAAASDLADAWANAFEHASESEQRPGMQTAPLGSMSEPPSVSSQGEHADGSGRINIAMPGLARGLVPGTFGLGEPPRAEFRKPSPSVVPWSEASPGLGKTSHPEAAAVAEENPGIWAEASSSAPDLQTAEGASAALPARGKKVLVLIAALVLGALTAALAVASLLSRTAARVPRAPPQSPAVQAPAPRAPIEPAPSPVAALPREQTAVVPVVEPTATHPEARRTSRRVATPAADEPPTPLRFAESDGVALMREAQSAFRRGAPEECIALVGRAIDHGAPAIALKLQADCLRRSGQNELALRSYERFCRLLPDHPAIGEVRRIVEGLGGRCP